MNIINDTDILDLIYEIVSYANSLDSSKTYTASKRHPQPSNDSLDIPISRVIYSGLATTVYFTDGTKTTVTCSANDHYDRQTAIVYALIKKIFGKVGRYDKNGNYHANEIDGNGIGIKLEKIAASGYDQDAEEKLAKEKKAVAKANHLAKQKAEHKAAWERRVRDRAEQIRLEREANALLDKEDSLKKTSSKILNENHTAMTANDFFNLNKPVTNVDASKTHANNRDAWKSYRKPDKPFSKFTQQEKREYWNYHNAKRRAAKN